jgi:hypothetical protein
VGMLWEVSCSYIQIITALEIDWDNHNVMFEHVELVVMPMFAEPSQAPILFQN